MGSYQRGRDYDERNSSRYRDEPGSRDVQGRLASDEDKKQARARLRAPRARR